MSDTNVNYASLVSLHNSTGGGYGYLSAPLIEDPSSFAVPSTGEQQNLDFLDEPYNMSWPDSKKNRWYEHNIAGVMTTPAAAAKRTLGEMESGRQSAAERRKAEMQASTPQAQAELAKAQAETAASQLELQEAYRQELEYQRSLATINNPAAPRAEWNAARMQMEGLASTIGKRINPKGGTSQTAMKETKNAVGYIGALEAKNPFSDFTPRLNTMLRGSQERMGLIRQQMEAAGVPVPETAPAPTATQEDVRAKTSDMVMSMAGVKDQSGNTVMIGSSPVIAVPEGGKPVYKKRGPGGGWVNLTQEEIASLGAQ